MRRTFTIKASMENRWNRTIRIAVTLSSVTTLSTPVSAAARGAVKMVKIAIDSPGGCIESRECYKRRDEDGW